ncbi:MAG: hypothetical protein F2667_02905 [Actinobacteria bacterium]|uniref:Unannotated protein n=1 Tax=freshwater metagenome TaxID=449393 RepID=A0A6J6PAQ3_9ZZZZ|nr:hypothetical protein [Actinomycetota bacterium]
MPVSPTTTPVDVPVPSTLRARLRHVAVGVLSAFVVLAGVAYVVAPSNPTLDFTVRELDRAPGYEHDLVAEYTLVSASTAARDRFEQTFYGEISSPSGVPIENVRLIISGATERLADEGATFRLRGTGTYRAVARLRPGRYDVAIVLVADGVRRRAEKEIRLRDGLAYDASVKVRESGIVTMLPISSY